MTDVFRVLMESIRDSFREWWFTSLIPERDAPGPIEGIAVLTAFFGVQRSVWRQKGSTGQLVSDGTALRDYSDLRNHRMETLDYDDSESNAGFHAQ